MTRFTLKKAVHVSNVAAVGPGAGGACAELQAGESLSRPRRHVGSVEDLELKGILCTVLLPCSRRLGLEFRVL